MSQELGYIAVFNPATVSTKTAGLDGDVKNGIFADVFPPKGPKKVGALTGGDFKTTAHSSYDDTSGLDFSFTLDAEDEATGTLAAAADQDEHHIKSVTFYKVDNDKKPVQGIFCDTVYVNEVADGAFTCNCKQFCIINRGNKSAASWNCETGKREFTGKITSIT